MKRYKLGLIFKTSESAKKSLLELTTKHTLKEISVLLNVDKGTVREWLNLFDIKLNKNVFKTRLTGRKPKIAYPEISKKQIEDSYFKKCKNQNEIAKENNTTKWYIQKLFKQYNITPRQTQNKNISNESEKLLNDADWLKIQHENFSLAEIARQLNVSETTVIKRFNKFNLEKHQSPGNNINKIFENDTQAYTILNELNQTLSLTEIASKYNVDIATVSIWFKKFSLTPKIHFISIEQKEIHEFIKTFEPNVELNNRTRLNGKEIDIYSPVKDIGIELNGLYWHTIDKVLNVSYHQNKTKEMEKTGGTLLQFYDYEWNNKKDIVKSMIKNKFIQSTTIFARKTSIQVVDNEIARNFLNLNHIQGSIISKVNIGLFFNSELVSLMSFSKNRYSNKTEWELTRFCNKLNTNVIGGASKLFKYFIVNYNPSSMLSYADRRYSKGNMYYKLGFSLNSINQPGYAYVINGKLESRQKWQKHKLKYKLNIFDTNLTEEQNMNKNNYHRIYDCGQLVFMWKNNKI